MIFALMKKKIERDGLTEECKQMLDVFFLGGRLSYEEYTELIKLGEE